jgi:hypothetical protein
VQKGRKPQKPPSCRGRVGELEIMYSQADFAMDLEKALARGFDVAKISKVAFEIYQDHGLEITASMDRALLTLMAMEEGEAFELTEPEFLALISEIKAM